jgi:hypothetical protein
MRQQAVIGKEHPRQEIGLDHRSEGRNVVYESVLGFHQGNRRVFVQRLGYGNPAVASADNHHSGVLSLVIHGNSLGRKLTLRGLCRPDRL